MPVSLELHNTGDPSIGAEIQALVEHHLSDRPGDWRVSVVGSRESDGWEMKVWGPNGFERSRPAERPALMNAVGFAHTAAFRGLGPSRS